MWQPQGGKVDTVQKLGTPQSSQNCESCAVRLKETWPSLPVEIAHCPNARTCEGSRQQFHIATSAQRLQGSYG